MASEARMNTGIKPALFAHVCDTSDAAKFPLDSPRPEGNFRLFQQMPGTVGVESRITGESVSATESP